MHDNKEMTNKEADEFIKLDEELTTTGLNEDSYNIYCELWIKAHSVTKNKLPTVVIAWSLNMLDYQQPNAVEVIKQVKEKYKDIKAPPDKINNILKGKILQEYKYIRPENIDIHLTIK